jgi:hypothetical protein
MDTHTDVVLYIHNLKKYFDNNQDVKKYFIGDNDEETFYDMVTNVAIINFHKRNEPNLNKLQFEYIRITLDSLNESYKEYIFTYNSKNIIFYFK